MYYFNNDYSEGAHPRILQRLAETNLVQTYGYGMDEYCRHAAELIKQQCQTPDASVHFLVGGTQTNMTVVDFLLKPYEGPLCADSGHINVHETGAVESLGHKVLTLTPADGKISAKQVEEAVQAHANSPTMEHTVRPGMVYISQPTEIGTLYSLQELTDLYEVCQRYHLPLFVDGARLGYGLMSDENDVTLPDLAKRCDVFYIGGTKVGLLFGEALVFTNPSLCENFRYAIKQKGGMLAKGRLLGVQFEEAFKDGLYYEMGRHGIEMAMQIKKAALDKGYPLFAKSPTNQQFFILPDEKLQQLSSNFVFEDMGRVDETHTAVRICTSWATTQEAVDALIEAL